MPPFRVSSPYEPAGDQPTAVQGLVEGINAGERFQTLLGITGSGKSATVAWTIEQVQKPTLSSPPTSRWPPSWPTSSGSSSPTTGSSTSSRYYDYYQPEAYMPSSDTYIEKDSSVNDEIDRLRHAATSALLTRRDTIVVASVSCIYGLGSPESTGTSCWYLKTGETLRPAGDPAASWSTCSTSATT